MRVHPTGTNPTPHPHPQQWNSPYATLQHSHEWSFLCRNYGSVLLVHIVTEDLPPGLEVIQNYMLCVVCVDVWHKTSLGGWGWGSFVVFLGVSKIRVAQMKLKFTTCRSLLSFSFYFTSLDIIVWNMRMTWVFVLCVLCFQSTNEAVFAVEFNPSDSTNIITCGKSHVYFWTLSSGQFTKKQGIFGVGQSVLTSFFCAHASTTKPADVLSLRPKKGSYEQ